MPCLADSEISPTPTKTSLVVSSHAEENTSKLREDVDSGSKSSENLFLKNIKEKLQQALQQRVPSVFQHTSAF